MCSLNGILADAWANNQIVYVQGDISDRDTVMKLIEGADCVWHLAAAVGPYHPEEVYVKVGIMIPHLICEPPTSRSFSSF
jgi:nucleoside-diphosphate-sugar epimerase